eukprot:CAMPEP_0202688356 /NCGR_PEP_ID=MMETSP1385-20130828/3881_1 /ASSEMBLY_ACC=CAM_ASM_000861 /TAXON_ID=933848 /ORGANISM="Elphidium margaritaceum" /LENGTH=213 /DNA_ID=CAMNT_0049343309 /DNA_START=93 /DNA_END=731 /DNA_ORIENTATION=+
MSRFTWTFVFIVLSVVKGSHWTGQMKLKNCKIAEGDVAHGGSHNSVDSVALTITSCHAHSPIKANKCFTMTKGTTEGCPQKEGKYKWTAEWNVGAGHFGWWCGDTHEADKVVDIANSGVNPWITFWTTNCFDADLAIGGMAMQDDYASALADYYYDAEVEAARGERAERLLNQEKQKLVALREERQLQRLNEVEDRQKRMARLTEKKEISGSA